MSNVHPLIASICTKLAGYCQVLSHT